MRWHDNCSNSSESRFQLDDGRASKSRLRGWSDGVRIFTERNRLALDARCIPGGTAFAPALLPSRSLVQHGGSRHPVFKPLRHLKIPDRQLEVLFAEIGILGGAGLLHVKGRSL